MKKKILDVCCGSRMMWLEKENKETVYVDNRIEYHELRDRTDRRGYMPCVIRPEVKADFKKLPFKNKTFKLVVFDPPHTRHHGKNGYTQKRYGHLETGWEELIEEGFAECFRVLKKNGILIFKWNECDIKVSEIMKLTKEKPLFGNRSGKQAKTHWITFMKMRKE
jgi:ubiquinone/menaquinone biosynthesis C-methylase UbiE